MFRQVRLPPVRRSVGGQAPPRRPQEAADARAAERARYPRRHVHGVVRGLCARRPAGARACRSASVPRALARQCSARLSLACMFASIAPFTNALARARRNRRPGPTTRMSVCGIGHGRQSGRPQHAPAVSFASCRTSCRARCCAARTARPARAGLPSHPSAWARALPKRSARLVAAPSAGAVSGLRSPT